MKKLSRHLAIVISLLMVLGSFSFAFADEDGGAQPNGLLWAKQVGGETNMGSSSGATPPVYDNGYLYTALDTSEGTKVYKINASNGESTDFATIDNGRIGSYATIPVTVTSSKILVPLGGAKIAIVDKANGQSRTVEYADNQRNAQTIAPIKAFGNNAYVGSWLGRKNSDGIRGTFSKVDVNSGQVTKIADSETGFYWMGAYEVGDYVLFGENSNGDDDSVPSEGTAKLYCWNSKATNVQTETTTETEPTETATESNEADQAEDVAESDEAEQEETVAESVEPQNNENEAIKTVEVKGSISSTIVEHNGAYYFTSKGGYLYKATINDGAPVIENSLSIGSPTTSTPYFVGDKIYVGSKNGVVETDSNLSETTLHKTPADTKHVAEVNGHIISTYNAKPGGIYDITEDWHYFIPDADKQQYCISNIAVNDSGDTLYYKNDRGYFFAVTQPTQPVRFDQSIKASSVSKVIGSKAFNLNAKAEGQLTYKSSATSVATVSSSGVVTPKNMGKTTITITAAETNHYKAATKKVTVTVVPKSTSGFKATAGKKKLTAKWTKNTKVTGQQITIAKNSSFKSGVKTYTVKGTKAKSKVIKGLTKGKYYYVKMRTYKSTSTGTVYSSSTSAKKVKIK